MFSTKKSISLKENKPYHLAFGAKGETEAVKYLKKNGYLIVETNFRTKAGEVDIIAQKGGDLHFVEVKSRASYTYGHALEAVTPAKQQKLIRAAKFYLHTRPEHENKGHLFSILTLMGNENDGWEIEFFPNAFGV